jgi:hypothetical protein
MMINPPLSRSYQVVPDGTIPLEGQPGLQR